MLHIARRRFLAAVAALLPALMARRASARPVVPDVMPAVPEACASGWWPGGGGWAYHPDLGWMHFSRLPRDLTPARWYGPPPPLKPGPAVDWGKIINGA